MGIKIQNTGGRKMKKAGVLTAAVLPLLFSALFAGGEAPSEKNSSPYFFVQGDASVESFPLLSTDVKADIAAVSANVVITQKYKNDGKKAIEAVYVFPLGTRSAVYAMRMKVGSRVIDAEINEKGKARQIYNDAKQQGKTASLLEQERPNVFTMNVANIMPGDIIEVTVSYTEILVPEEGKYAFVYPMVVGPRFTGESAKNENWTASPYTKSGTEPSYDVSMEVNINAGMEVSGVSSSTHRISAANDGKKSRVTFAPGEKRSGNRDFVLEYSLRGGAIQTGMLMYPGEKENFFMLMMEPPARPSAEAVTPREYFFIVDVSGSMHGYPLEISKKVIKTVLDGMTSRDYFNVMFFSGGSNTLFPQAMPATAGNVKKAVEMVEAARGSGGTEILGALQSAFKVQKKEGMSRSFVIFTDGYVSVEKQTFDLMRDNLGNANFFTFGIGSSVNRYIIEGMARIGKGEPYVALNKEEGEKTAEKFIKYIKTPLLTDIKVKYEGFDAYDVEPENVPDLFSERPLVIMGKYKNAKGKIIVTGKNGDKEYRKEILAGASLDDAANSSLKYMWARERIARLSDYGRTGSDVKGEVLELGLKYSLMTEYTSFVAVDKEIRNNGEVVTVKQPLPMPDGVSDYAVGGNGSYQAAYSTGTKSYAAGGLMMKEEASMDFAAPAPGYPGKRKFSVPETEEAKKPAVQPAGELYLTDTESAGVIDPDVIEAEMVNRLGAEIKALMAAEGITKLNLEFDVENGKFKKLISGNAKFEKLLKKMKFENYTAKLKVTLELM